jgi:iron-siderophore transport system permease protein
VSAGVLTQRRLPRGVVAGSGPRAGGLAVAAVVLFGVVVASIAVGAKSIPLGSVADAFTGYDRTLDDHLIVRTLRIPRTEVGLLVGVALGLGGAVMQGVARNPLADPGILGVDAGSALLVVVAIYLLGVTSLLGYVWFALAGAAGASVAVYAIGSLGPRGATPIKLSLAGAAITVFLGSITSAILINDLETLERFSFWVVGSLDGRTTEMAAQVAPFVLVGSLLAFACAPALNALALGDDVARGLGQRVGLARAISALAVVLLCGSAVAVAGPIAFVGLVIPHIARMITGPDYRWVLPYSMVLGPILVLGADVIGRVVIRPAELQVGIVTAAVGAPFFIWLVRKRDMAEL